MIRPEKMSAYPAGTETKGQNAVTAQVREVVFMGDMTRYALETPGGHTILVKQQNRAGLPVLAPDQPAIVSWAIEDTRLVS